MSQQHCLSGIINVNKPKGFTSHQVVSKLRKILGVKQIGHTGTLDPMAVGVLPVCVGKATRIIEYLSTSKAYRAYILLGVTTDTYDIEGEILDKKPVKLDKEKVNEFLQEFKGEITQIPPMYSAVHYQGKRLYEYARKNIEIKDIPSRKVVINDIKLINIENEESENPILVVDIDCSGGTYIRSIAYDLGQKLGCGACLNDLIRTKSGNFKLEDSFTLDEIQNYFQNNQTEKFLLSPVKALDLEILQINEEQKDKIQKGQYFYIDKTYEQEEIIQLVYEDNLAAIAKIKGNQVKPLKVFCE